MMASAIEETNANSNIGETRDNEAEIEVETDKRKIGDDEAEIEIETKTIEIGDDEAEVEVEIEDNKTKTEINPADESKKKTETRANAAGDKKREEQD